MTREGRREGNDTTNAARAMTGRSKAGERDDRSAVDESAPLGCGAGRAIAREGASGVDGCLLAARQGGSHSRGRVLWGQKGGAAL